MTSRAPHLDRDPRSQRNRADCAAVERAMRNLRMDSRGTPGQGWRGDRHDAAAPTKCETRVRIGTPYSREIPGHLGGGAGDAPVSQLLIVDWVTPSLSAMSCCVRRLRSRADVKGDGDVRIHPFINQID